VPQPRLKITVEQGQRRRDIEIGPTLLLEEQNSAGHRDSVRRQEAVRGNRGGRRERQLPELIDGQVALAREAQRLGVQNARDALLS